MTSAYGQKHLTTSLRRMRSVAGTRSSPFVPRRRVIRVYHTLSLGGRDPMLRQALERLGVVVANPRPGTPAWRTETCFRDVGSALALFKEIEEIADVSLRCVARFGAKQLGQINSLPFMHASSVRPCIVKFHGRMAITTSSSRVECARFEKNACTTSTLPRPTTSLRTDSSRTTRSMASAEPSRATSSLSGATSRMRAWSSSSRTTARPRRIL